MTRESTGRHSAARTDAVPADPALRRKMRSAARRYTSDRGLLAPLPLVELRRAGEALLEALGLGREFADFATVLIGNEVWRDALAAVPYNRRLLLLPQCLRPRETCLARVDALGLICRRCGQCELGGIQAAAESLGYVVLIAEGTSVVTSLVAGGRVDAVVGVSCLSVLERVFPYTHRTGVPGAAVPLLRDGCTATMVDSEWVHEILRLRGGSGRMNLDELRTEVRGWFTPARLDALIGAPDGQTERIARDWLALAGKRWRPFLVACAHDALSPAAGRDDSLGKLAVAVECFHKASLIHDDIEDDDELRYGQRCLHASHGVPMALNAGDFLIGEGYRLIADAGAPPERIARMLAVAADGHRRLCKGQGAELAWARSPGPLDSAGVLGIFGDKTSPSFSVALRIGAIHAGANGGSLRALDRYSAALGVAYQIRDDLEDFDAPGGDLDGRRPSLPLAIGWERASGADRRVLESLWTAGPEAASCDEVRAVLDRLDAPAAAGELLERYRQQAIDALDELESPALATPLRQVLARIFEAAPSARPER